MSKFLRIVEDADPTIDSEAKDVIQELFNDAHVADVTYNNRVISVHFKEGGTLKLKYISLSKNEEDGEQQLMNTAVNAIGNATKPSPVSMDSAARNFYKAKEKLSQYAVRFVDNLGRVFNKLNTQ